MKKLFLLLLSVTAVLGVYAQAGTKGIGADIAYGTEIKSLGVGAKIQYNYTDPVRYDFRAGFYAKNDYTTLWDLNLNINYLFNVAPKVKIYPLCGISYSNWKFDYDGMTKDLGGWFDDFDLGKYKTEGKTKHVNRIGINLGAGGEYYLNEYLAVNFEVKYQFIKNFSQTVLNAGIVYRFK